MVKPIPSWLKTFNPAASTSKKEAPKAESSSKAKKGDQKEDPPASPRSASPPPGYATVAPRAMPAGSSRAIVRRGDHDRDKNRYGSSRHRHDDHSEDDRDDRKGKEVVRRGKSRRDPSESESESDRGYKSKKKGKEVVKREKDSKKKNKKSKKKQESDSESDSDEQIVEKRKRFEAVSIGELNPDYVGGLRKCFEVRIEKIDKWCDDGLIRMDTKDGSLNADKLLNSKKVEEDEKKKWAVFEKKYRRHIEETPGGDMHFIPRFEKYLPKGPSRGRSGPSVVVVSRNPSPPPYPSFYYPCAECCYFGSYCGDPRHRGMGRRMRSESPSY